jgi:hypothetical protein
MWPIRTLSYWDDRKICPPNPDIEKRDIADRPDLERFF